MRFPRTSRLGYSVVGALSVAVLAAACSSSGGGTAGTAATSPGGGQSAGGQSAGGAAGTSIVVGALPVLDTAGLQVAVKEGYFKQAGLSVTVKSVTQSTAAIPDLLHGSIDVIGGGNYVSFLEAQANGTFGVEFLAPADNCTPGSYGLVAMPSSGITRPSDLAGKTVAVNLTQNVQTLTTDAVLKAAGLAAGSVRYVQVPFPDMVSALQAGRVSAISVIEPFLSAALAAGGKLVTSTCTGPAASFPLSAYVTTQGWAQQHAAAARAFTRALDKGNAFAQAHPDVVRGILPSYTKITAKAAAAMPLPEYPASMTPALLQQVAALMKGGGLAAPPNVAALVFS